MKKRYKFHARKKDTQKMTNHQQMIKKRNEKLERTRKKHVNKKKEKKRVCLVKPEVLVPVGRQETL